MRMKNEVHLAHGAMRWAAPPPDNFRDDSGAVAAKGEIVSLLFINNCCWGSPKPIANFYGQDRHQVTERLAYKHWEGRGRPLGAPLMLTGMPLKTCCVSTCWLRALRSAPTGVCTSKQNVHGRRPVFRKLLKDLGKRQARFYGFTGFTNFANLRIGRETATARPGCSEERLAPGFIRT